MLIYHCVVCHRYELRHGWQVSSIVENYGDPMPDIHLDVAVLRGYKTKLRYPMAEAARRNPRVKLSYHLTKKSVFAYRGFVRNEQIKRALAAKADWIFFSDCDRVYHPRFFSELARQLKKLGNCTKLIAQAERVSTQLEDTDRVMTTTLAEWPHHANAYYRIHGLPVGWRRNYYFASGGMQVVSRQRLEEKGGWYANPHKKLRDSNLFTRGQLARSDVYFRWRMGGSHMIELPLCFHLEHRRDKETPGVHLDIQR
jgi:hypothetical protein